MRILRLFVVLGAVFAVACTIGGNGGLTIDEHRLVAVADVKPRGFGFDFYPLYVASVREQFREWPKVDAGSNASLRLGEKVGDNTAKTGYFHPQRVDGHIYSLSEKSMSEVLGWITITWEVLKDEKPVFSFNCAESATEPGIKNFIAYAGGWVVECSEKIYLNGEDLAKKWNANRAFNFAFYRGEIFYFIERDGKIRPVYDDILNDAAYDEVLHDLCCEASSMNPNNNDMSIGFYARKDGYWYYVQAGMLK